MGVLMTEWLLLALLAAGMWGMVNVIDKIIVEKHITNPLIYLIFSGVYGLIPAVFLAILGIQSVSISIIFLSMLTGVILIAYTYLYFKALQYSDTSVVVSLLQMIPIFSLLWGYLFFGEVFGPLTYVGIVLILAGATLISIPSKIEKSNIDRGWKKLVSYAMLLMIPSTFLASIGYAIQNYTVEYGNSATIFFWGRIGALLSIGILFLSKKLRDETLITLRKVGLKINLTVITNEIISVVAVFAVIYAYSIGSLSLVSTTLSIQPFFAISFVLIINSLRKNTIPDNTTKKVFLKRIIYISMLVIGVYLLSLG